MTRREALIASIAHWRENAKAETWQQAKIGPDHCALCGLCWDKGCKGCPILEKTGRISCIGSPYEAACDAWLLWGYNPASTARRAAFHATAAAMAEYLEQLLKEEPEG